MVFPLLPIIGALAGTAASAAGSMISGQEDAANQIAAIRARNEAVRQELKRQNKFTRKSADIFTDSLGMYRPEAIARRTADAGQTVGNAVSGNLPTDFGSIGSMLAPSALAADGAMFASRGAAEGQQFGDSLGSILTRDQYLTDNARKLAQKAHKLGLVSDFSQGSARVSNIEQAVAGQNSQQQPSIWGPLLQAGGTVAGYLGGKNQVGIPAAQIPASTRPNGTSANYV